MTYKTGTIGEFMTWTKRVVTDPAAAESAPKRWFDTDETAARTLGTTASVESMVKLLSEENLRLLSLIRTKRPASVQALAELAHRSKSNLSRTLKKLKEVGIVEFERGEGRELAPRVVASRVTLDLDLGGPGSVVSVQRRKQP